MTLPMMIYGAVLALLVAGAAHFIDRGLRSLRRPTRWVWLAALVVGGLAPFIPKLIRAGVPEATGDAGLSLEALGLPIEPLYEVGAMGASGTAAAPPLLLAVESSLSLLWILGSVLVLIVFAQAWLRLRRQREAWETRNVSGEDVLLSERLGPAVLGMIRPRIVLPSWALALPKKDLELVMLHEREHRKARDPALLAAGLLLTAISPWNPAVWWTLRRLRLAVEGDCDGRVLARGVAPKSYVQLLIEIASRAGRVPALAQAMTEAGETSLRKRLMMIRSTVGKHRVWASVLAAAAGVALLVVACETPVPQESQELADVNLSVTQTEAAGRLATAVESSWITQGQAGGITDALDDAVPGFRRAVAAGEMTELQAIGRYVRMEVGEVGSAIRTRVAEGAMTEHAGQAAYQGYLGLIRAGKEDGGRDRASSLRVRLAVAIDSNWITREQAGAIGAQMIRVQHRLQAGVETGAMTREEAGDAYPRYELEAIGEAIRERVAAGALTAEEGRAAMEAYRELMKTVNVSVWVDVNIDPAGRS
jgi:beta-lactamase regulating signal transducer with metallopeptidase domain